MRDLVAKTVSPTHPVQRLYLKGGSRVILSFREGDPVAIPITTDFGPLFFYLGQALEAVEQDSGGYRLRTRQYWYRIQEAPNLKEKALLRWEYDFETDRTTYCRHHAQARVELAFGGASLSLDKAHLPTGWVTMEEVIRFLIHELGHRPPCGDDWPDVLEESERLFYEEFSSRLYRGGITA